MPSHVSDGRENVAFNIASTTRYVELPPAYSSLIPTHITVSPYVDFCLQYTFSIHTVIGILRFHRVSEFLPHRDEYSFSDVAGNKINSLESKFKIHIKAHC